MTLTLIPGMTTCEATFGLTKERADELLRCAGNMEGSMDDANQRLVDECDNDNELVYAFMARGIMLGTYMAEKARADKNNLAKAHLN